MIRPKPRSQNRHAGKVYQLRRGVGKAGRKNPARTTIRSQEYPDFGHMNKLYGLKKLRIIAKHLQGIAYVSPFKVYDSPSQFRASHATESQRVLIRSDERGKRYSRWTYSLMPRREVEPINSEQIRGNMQAMRLMPSERFIVHPTRPIRDIFSEGKIDIYGRTITVRLEAGGVSLPALYFDMQTGQLDPVRDKRNVVLQQLAKNIEKVIQEGLKSRQIKQSKNRNYQLRFLTWEQDPTLLELYDLKELRRLEKTPKGTKTPFKPHPFRGFE